MRNRVPRQLQKLRQYVRLTDPIDLFPNGEQGLWWDASSTNYMTQDSAGTIPVTVATDPVGLMIDRTGNGNDGVQATTSLKPLYQTTPSRIEFDKVDDVLSTVLSSSIDGTMMLATSSGLIHCEVAISAGAYNVPRTVNYFPGDDVEQLIVRDGVLSISEEIFLKDYLGNGIYAPTGSLQNAFSSRADITKIYSNDWDMSDVTNLQSFVGGCYNLVELDTSGWDTSSVTSLASFSFSCLVLQALATANWNTSSVTDLSAFATGCSNIVELDVSAWDVSKVTNCASFVKDCVLLTSLDLSSWDLVLNTNANLFANGCTSLSSVNVGTAFDNSTCVAYNGAFTNCALSQTSVDAILVSINNAATNNGVLGIGGVNNATPSAIGQAATDALRARGWTVTLNGY